MYQKNVVWLIYVCGCVKWNHVVSVCVLSLSVCFVIFIEDYADVQIPAQPTYAAYSNGRGNNDPNTLDIDDDGNFVYMADIDFDPRKKGQAPLPNKLSTVLQTGFPASIGTEEDYLYDNLQQTTYEASGRFQDIGREFIRVFNDKGANVLDGVNNPELARSPRPFSWMPIVAHLDFLTHGTDSAIFSTEVTTNHDKGDHFGIIRFDLGDLTEV